MVKTSLFSNPINPLVTVDSMVDSLASLNSLGQASHTKILNLARKAILAGDLPSHDAETTARIKDPSQATPLVIPQDFNKWVASTGMTLKLPATKPKRVRLKKPVAQTNNWKLRVQEQATKHMLASRKKGSNPTVLSILDDIHTWCIQNNIKTPRGLVPSKGYIRTHALGGRYWSLP